MRIVQRTEIPWRMSTKTWWQIASFQKRFSGEGADRTTSAGSIILEERLDSYSERHLPKEQRNQRKPNLSWHSASRPCLLFNNLTSAEFWLAISSTWNERDLWFNKINLSLLAVKKNCCHTERCGKVSVGKLLSLPAGSPKPPRSRSVIYELYSRLFCQILHSAHALSSYVTDCDKHMTIFEFCYSIRSRRGSVPDHQAEERFKK